MTRVRLDSLTGLRFMAAFAVFLLHASVFFTGTSSAHNYSFVSRQGGVGVSFFFLLSGFVLTWSSRPGDSTRAFYRRRAARILPLYYLTAFASVVVLQLENGVGSKAGAGGFLASLTLLQAWIPRQGTYYGGNGVAWSLSAELFFYALFPLIIVRLRPLSTRALATLGAVVAVVVIAFPIAVPDSNFARWLTYIFPAFRLLEFVLGCILAILVRGGLRLPIWAAGVVVFGSWVGAGQMNLHAGRVSSVTLIGFAMLIVAAASSDLNGTSRLLRNQWAIRFGEWSFAFYLVHQLVIRAIDSQIDPAGSGEAILAAMVALVVSVALAATLFYVVERPLERRLRGDGTLPVTMTEADEPSAADTIIEEARLAELQGGIRQIRASSGSPRRKV